MVLSDISPKIRGKPGRVRIGFGLRIHRITADVGSLAIIRGLGGFLIAPCRHQQGGKRKSEAFYAEHDCASTAHARFEGTRRGTCHSLSIPPSFSVGCNTLTWVLLTNALTLSFIYGL